jgi:hypothetical protein
MLVCCYKQTNLKSNRAEIVVCTVCRVRYDGVFLFGCYDGVFFYWMYICRQITLEMSEVGDTHICSLPYGSREQHDFQPSDIHPENPENSSSDG